MPAEEQKYAIPARVIFAVAVWAGLFLLGALIPGHWLIGIGAWITATGLSLPLFLVLVPEVMGLVTLNFFNGNLFAFGSGVKIKFPWDIVRDENFFSLELVTEQHQETYATKDGPLMLTKWSYQYRPHEKKLDKYITVDKTTIDNGFTDVFSSILSEAIGGKNAEPARQEIAAIEAEVMEQFHAQTMGGPNGPQTQSPKEKLEDEYGVNFKLFKLPDIDFAEDYQQARSGQARMAVIIKAAQELIQATVADGKPTISGKEAVNTVLVEQGKATKNIVEIEGNADATQRAAATLGAMLKGGK